MRHLSPCPIVSVLTRACRSAQPASLRFVRKRENGIPAASPVFQRSLSLHRPKSRGKFAGAVIAHRSGDLCNAGLRFFPKQQSRPIHPQCPHIGVHRTAIYTFEAGLHGGQRDLVLSGQSLQRDMLIQMLHQDVYKRQGYQNPSRFAEIFRRNTGRSPAEYRRACWSSFTEVNDMERKDSL